MNDNTPDIPHIAHIDEMPEDIKKFWAEHLARGPNHLVGVTALCQNGCCTAWAVFSTIEGAQAWMNKLNPDKWVQAVAGALVVNADPFEGNGVPKTESEKAKMN